MKSTIQSLRQRLFGKPFFATRDVSIGRNTKFGRNVVFNCKKVRIGDGVVFFNNIEINAEVFEIGDYGIVYHDSYVSGNGALRIGHNFWLGNTSIIDSLGGTRIGNNVGIGAHSQLWTHMIFGDVLFGSRFHSVKSLEIGDDVWLVGHCLVSPVTIGPRSLALLGSTITRDIEPDKVYGGVPAIDMTSVLGKPFQINPVEERMHLLEKRLDAFARQSGISDIYAHVRIVVDANETVRTENVTVFNVANRTYAKCGTALEHRLIWFLLPTAKFLPVNA
jgi:acetyltransferase-like isoleucine patch superfamily enzyme